MAFMEPDVNHGGYWHVETWGGSFIVPDDALEGAEPTPANLAQYMPESVGMTIGSDDSQDRDEWVIERRTGWYGRLSAPGYLDCTDWESAESEAELLESLGGDDDDEDSDDDDDSEDEPASDATPAGWDAIDAGGWHPADSADVPNLDNMTIDPDELRAWASAAPLSIPEPARGILVAYANAKADAMDYRAIGRGSLALRMESQCSELYDKLPPEYRW